MIEGQIDQFCTAVGAKTGGLTIADVLTLPKSVRRLVNWMMRQETVNLAQAAAHLGQPEEAARITLDTLIGRRRGG